jgi:hypothetical protein
MIAPSETRADNRPMLWVAWGVLAYGLAAVASLFVVAGVAPIIAAPLGLQLEAGSAGLSVRNGFHAIVWGAAAAALAMPVGRRFVAGLRFGSLGWVILGFGLLLAGLTTTLVEEFVRVRLGLYVPRATGFTIFSGPTLVAISLAAWAAPALPRRDRVLVAALGVAAIGFLLTLLPSLPGAADGISDGSLPLAATLAFDALFAIGVTGIVIRSSRSLR